MEHGPPQTPHRGPSLLIEHVTVLAADDRRLTARERLERVLGGHLARMLVAALTGRRPRSVEVD